MKKENTSIKYSMFWNSFGSMTYLLFQWIITVLITRILGFDDAGIFSLAMSITNIFACIALFGVRNFQVSDINAKYSDVTYLVCRYITCLSSIGICLIFVLSQPYSFKIGLCVMIYMIFRAAEAFVDVLHGVDQKFWRMDIVGKSFLLRGTLMLLSAFLIMYSTKNLLFTIAVMTISTILVIIFFDCSFSFKKIARDKKLNLNELKSLLIEAFPLSVYLIMLNTMGSIPRLFLERIAGSEKLGVYASIATPALIVQVSASFIFTPLIGLFAEYYNDNNKKKFVNLFYKVIAMILLISIVAIVATILLGDLGLKILYGETILEFSYLLLPVIMCTILTAFSWFLCMVLTVMREIKGLIFGCFLGLLCNGIGSPYFIKWYDMNGASYITIIGAVVQIAIFLVVIITKTRKKWPKVVD